MPSPELSKLIVDHLDDLDAAALQLLAVQAEVFRAIGDMAASWAEKNGWAGVFDYIDDRFWMAPEDWRTPGTARDKNSFRAWFQMELGAGDTDTHSEGEDFFYLTRLCRQGHGQIGFRFVQEITTKGVWKKNFKNQVGLLSRTAFVVDTEPSFFLPFQLDKSELSQALLDQVVENALHPFEGTLVQLASAKAAFDAVIAAIKPAES